MVVGDWVRRFSLVLIMWKVAVCWMDHFIEVGSQGMYRPDFVRVHGMFGFCR